MYTKNKKIVFSIALQICKIVQIIGSKGYIHNDLHSGNLMVIKTDDKFFDFNGKKIPTYGNQIVCIDYGNILHKKYKNYEDWYKEYLTTNTNKQLQYNEIFRALCKLFNNILSLNISQSKRIRYKTIMNELKYSNPKFYSYVNKKHFGGKGITQRQINYKYWGPINLVKFEIEMRAYNLKLYNKYFLHKTQKSWTPTFLVSKKDMIKFLGCKTFDDVHAFLLSKF